MKTPLVLFLAASLAGNAVLAFFVLRPDPVHLASGAASPDMTKPRSGGPAAPADVVSPAPAAPVNWQTLRPGQNLHGFVANLRTAGFPPAAIRAVVNQMISERLDTSAVDHLPFWKQNGNNPEYVAAQQLLSSQRHEMLVDLLGADANLSATLDPAARARRYGNLSDDKIDRLDTLSRDYNDLRSKLYADRKSGDAQGTMAAQLAVEQEQRAELATFLTPIELEQYEMRTSQSANRLMNNLKNLEVTEAEYTALFRAQKAYDQQDPLRAGVVTPEAMALRASAQEQLNEQARAVLSDNRFYEYLKGADQNYARTAQFTANYPTITPAMTYDLTKLEREYQASAMSMARTGNTGAPSPERASQFMAMRKDYQEKLNTLLGPEIGGSYLQRNRMGITTQTIRTGP